MSSFTDNLSPMHGHVLHRKTQKSSSAPLTVGVWSLIVWTTLPRSGSRAESSQSSDCLEMHTRKTIEGEYYTVNPMAIRSALDVYGENVRVVVPIDSVAHGRVMIICVGAMMVGSTVITRHPGENVKRAEELGYFKFGGSTILLLFEEGTMKFDDDLVENSNGALETLVRSFFLLYFRSLP
jgi:hypothetical protein